MPKQHLIEKFTQTYVEQLREYDSKILNAQSLGGLGIGDLVTKGNFTGGINRAASSDLGFCFRCRQTGGSCKSATVSSNSDPTVAYSSLTSYQFCNTAAFTYQWLEIEHVHHCLYEDCYPYGGCHCAAYGFQAIQRNEYQNVQDNTRGYECCSCSCLEESKFASSSSVYPFAGTADDHKVYDRHCPDREMVYPIG